jgi:hypothetical protein
MTNWTERLIEAIDRLTSHGDSPNGPGHRLILTVDVDELERLAAEARTALAQPEPEPVGEAKELVDWLNASAREWADLGEYDEGSKCHRAADILTRYAHPTTEPVPVAERLPGPTMKEVSDWVARQDDDWTRRVEHHDAIGVALAAIHDFMHHTLPVPGADEAPSDRGSESSLAEFNDGGMPLG